MTLGARTTNRPVSRPVKLVLKTQATHDGADGPRLPLDPKAIGGDVPILRPPGGDVQVGLHPVRPQ